MIRLTWVQPEDLVGHELRQADEDGRGTLPEVAAVRERWHAAGGHDAPPRAGASAGPAPEALRALAGELLDALAAIPSPLPEPSGLEEIVASCPGWPDSPGARPRVRPEPGRVLAAWWGRAAGCLLGKPVEKIPREGIRAIAEATGNWPIRGWFTAKGLPPEIAERWPWNRRSAATSLAENIDGVPEDDDLNYALLALTVIERHGRDFTTEDVAKTWLDALPAGRVFTAERAAYRNLLAGLEPPATAVHRNPFREWIGALIRADVYGWANPGDPATAAVWAWRDARLSHAANGIYGAMFAAAMCAQALVAEGVDEVIEAGLSVVPPGSRLAEAVRQAVADAAAEPDFERVVDRLYARHGHLHWVHTVNNAALLAAALVHGAVHGAGDFAAIVGAAVAGGWDTDSAAATAGSIAGALTGGVPERWTTRDRLASSLPGFDGISIESLAARTLALGEGERR
ncbi:ADP-ribosylglycohydrolase family protein [Microbispora hainanensis]|uniref:ADP-ribosylglycohydrolase family protein n=1 Tax=Microbispora hainanensis TaxID=568844 RepID=A0A544Z2T5_9ACTN|nr:ADP-ribosylglycohydrolase family protein [Microbispora hainanensis]TQS23201.1 ADP-ribosylglycohydrolase family protein [Microbispora hainanensis]